MIFDIIHFVIEGKVGERYIGQYEKGFRTGYGTFYYSDGRSFVGTFLNDNREGPGIMYYPQGFRREGIWITDKLLGEVRKYMDNETILEIWLGKVLIKFAIISADLCIFKFVSLWNNISIHISKKPSLFRRWNLCWRGCQPSSTWKRNYRIF